MNNRAERRRQRREDAKRITRGFDARFPAGGQVVALMRALDARLQICIRRRSVTPLMEFVYSSISSGERLIGDVRIACRRGCSHCCHSWVDAGPAEVLFAVKAMGKGQRQRAIETVERMCGQTAGKEFEERSTMVTPCPLLQDHMCTAYEARPIVCRSAVSADADACRRSYLEQSGESIPVPSLWRTLGQAYAIAIEAAVLHRSLVATAREWNESLRLALSDPTAEGRWLSGEDVFRGLPCASASRTFANPSWAAVYREAFADNPPLLA